MRIPQSGLNYFRETIDPKRRSCLLIRYARIQTVHYVGDKNNRKNPGTVDVKILENNKFAGLAHNCWVAQNRAGFNEKGPYGKVWLPKVNENVLLLYIDGMLERPVVFKSMHALFSNESIVNNLRITDPQDYIDRKINVHESMAWNKIDKLGNFEFHLPDGSFIQFTNNAGSASFPNTPPDDIDLSEKHGEDDQTEKYWIFSHPSGTWIRINNDGSVEMVVQGNLNAKVNGQAKIQATNIELEAPQVTIKGNLTVEGNLDTNGATTTHDHDVIIPGGSSAGTYTTNDRTDGDV